jgi:hypothetical protein
VGSIKTDVTDTENRLVITRGKGEQRRRRVEERWVTGYPVTVRWER